MTTCPSPSQPSIGTAPPPNKKRQRRRADSRRGAPGKRVRETSEFFLDADLAVGREDVDRRDGGGGIRITRPIQHLPEAQRLPLNPTPSSTPSDRKRGRGGGGTRE
eukprot:1584210-Rhodomonas_salina.1